MLYETIIGLALIAIGASQATTTKLLAWPRKLFSNIFSGMSDRSAAKALKFTLGWPLLAFGILVALPLPERYDMEVFALLVVFFLIYWGSSRFSAPRIGQSIDDDVVDATPQAQRTPMGGKVPKT